VGLVLHYGSGESLGFGGAATTYSFFVFLLGYRNYMVPNVSGADCCNVLSWSLFSESHQGLALYLKNTKKKNGIRETQTTQNQNLKSVICFILFYFVCTMQVLGDFHIESLL